MRVVERVMGTDVVHDTRVLVAVCTGERDSVWELDGAVALDFDLNTIGVELGASLGVRFVGDVARVQTDHFGADQVAVD
jgi:hypothetical protein